MLIPHIIAICGLPGSGKTTTQNLLEKHYGVIPIDDGKPMRDFCIQHLGMSHDDVYTAEGKEGTVEILGKTWQRRKILGEIGRCYEEMFGASILSYIATLGLNPRKSYSFGSVRMGQAAWYRDLGGLVLGVRSPGIKPTGNTWDTFDESLVHLWLENNALWAGDNAEDARSDLLGKIAITLHRANKNLDLRLVNVESPE